MGDDPQLVAIELDALGGSEMCPGIDVPAVGLEALDAQVAPVADPDRAIGGDRDRVTRVELAGRGAGLPPLAAVAAVGIEHDDSTVAVAIGDVDRAVGPDRDV